MVKIKEKCLLRKLLHNEGYDVIIFWEGKNGLTWDTVTSSFDCCIDFDGKRVYPFARIERRGFYNRTYKEINERMQQIEEAAKYGSYAEYLENQMYEMY